MNTFLARVKGLVDEHFTNSVWLTSKNIGTAVLSFGIAYAAANYLTPETYGSYKYILGLASIIAVFSLSGSGQAVTRTIAKYSTIPLRFIAKKNFQYSFFAVTTLLVIAIYYAWQGNYTFSLAIAFAAVMFPITTSLSVLPSFYNGTQQYKSFSLSNLYVQFVITTCVVTTIFVSGELLWLVISFFGGGALAYCSLTLYMLSVHNFPNNTDKDHETLQFSKKLSVVNFVPKATDLLDIFLIFQLVGPAATAVYAIARTPVNILQTQAGVVKNLALPRFSAHTPALVQSSIHQKALFFSFLMSLVVAGYILIAPYIYSILFPAYLEAIYYSQVLSLLLPAISYLLYIEAITAAKNVKLLFMVQTVAPLLQFVVLFIATLFYGLPGMVFGFVIGFWLKALFVIGSYYWL